MNTTDLEDFRCILCRQYFVPPSVLPHLLPCTHYLCTPCLQHAQHNNHKVVICPEDLQTNTVKDIRTNCPARKVLERLVKEHASFNQNNQLLSIQALSKHFQSVLESKNKEKMEFEQLIERVIENEVQRLKNIQNSIREEMNFPLKMVREWKNMVKEYLSLVRTMDRKKKEDISNELGYYIEQGRRIKSDLMKFQNLNYSQIANIIAGNPSVCLRNEFSLQNYMQINQNIKQPRQPRETGLGDLEEDNKEEERGEKESLLSCYDKSKTFGKCSRGPKERKNQENYENSLSDNANFQRGRYIAFGPHSRINEPLQKASRMSSQVLSYKESLSNKSRPLMESSKNQSSNLLYDAKLIYSSSPSRYEILDMNSDEILLTENEPIKPHSERYNFLQQWEIHDSISSEGLTIERKEPFSLEKEKNSYIRKMQCLKVEEAVSESTFQHNTLELINFPVADMDMSLYLQHWDWKSLQVVKFVKTGLNDQQFNELLNFILQSKVATLVLSSNCLGEISLDALLNYTKMDSTLKNVYLSKNQINTLRGRTRHKITLLREQGINLYI